MKRLIDILRKTSQYESVKYANDYCCPECDKSGIGRRREKKSLLTGWCETPSGYMAICECPVCGCKFRFHPNLDRFDIDAFNEQLEFHYLGPVDLSLVANSEELDEELSEINKKN